MGIRIHKILGYGLTNVKSESYRIQDKRFNPNGIFGLDWEAREEKYTIKGFQTWLEKKLESTDLQWDEKADIQWQLKSLKEPKFYCLENLLIWNSDYGLSKVFCVIPSMHYGQWHRYDDSIDYHEETNSHRNQVNRCKKLKSIFPYSIYCDTRTGERKSFDLCLAFLSPHCDQEYYAQKLGFKSVKECRKYLKPSAPYSVRHLVEYCDIFSNPKTVLS